jgi:alpha-beta hydrolase superfamily lysophospholipase
MLVIAVRGTYEPEDVWSDVQLMRDRLQETNRFKEVEAVYKDMLEKHPTAKIFFAGHSLGGGVIYEMIEKYKDSIQGHLFNPAISPRMMTTFDPPKGLTIHSIEGDPVSSINTRFMPNVETYRWHEPLIAKKADATLKGLYNRHTISAFL